MKIPLLNGSGLPFALGALAMGSPVLAQVSSLEEIQLSPEERVLKLKAIERVPEIDLESNALFEKGRAALKICDTKTILSLLPKMRSLGDEYKNIWEDQYIGEGLPIAPDFDPKELVMELSDILSADMKRKCGVKELQYRGRELRAKEPNPELEVVSLADAVRPTGRDPDTVATKLTGLYDICQNPDGGGLDRDFAKSRYGKLYRELRAARDEYRKKGAQEPAGPTRNSYLESYRKYEAVLNKLPHPAKFDCPPDAPETIADQGVLLTRENPWEGTWNARAYGNARADSNAMIVSLKQESGRVTGTFTDPTGVASIADGRVSGSTLRANWNNPHTRKNSGTLIWTLSPDQKTFSGTWKGEGNSDGTWTGIFVPDP